MSTTESGAREKRPRRNGIPSTIKSLRSWLLQTRDGSELLESLIEGEVERRTAERLHDEWTKTNKYKPVVIELTVDRNGQCHGRVYGSRKLRVRVVERMDLTHAKAQEYEREEILRRMPLHWQAVYESKCRETFCARRRTLATEFARQADLDTLELLKCSAITRSSGATSSTGRKEAGENSKTGAA